MHDAAVVQVRHPGRHATCDVQDEAGRGLRIQSGADITPRAVLEHQAVCRRLDDGTHALRAERGGRCIRRLENIAGGAYDGEHVQFSQALSCLRGQCIGSPARYWGGAGV